MSLQLPPTELPGLRPLSPKEQVQRASAFACLSKEGKPSCSKVIWTSVFFDGTNNNLKRDTADNSHSNIVVLHNSHKPDVEGGDYFPLYIPGVGTAFPEIGEMHESAEGKSQAKGGDTRIHYAMIQIYNAVHRAVVDDALLVKDDEALNAVRADRYTEDNLNVAWTFGKGKRTAYFKALETRLKLAIRNKKPEIKMINISVFGFSRGAAQARTFCNWLLECCQDNGGSYKFCDIPIRFQFLGLFDTVASVGIADSSPVGSGLMDWADGTMEIPKAVERTVHYVAAHEIRQNFPLSTGRNGKAYPANCIEVVYPGAHSDVGGGYAAKDQGKAAYGRAHMASQVPLIHMYQEAIKSGVPFRTLQDLEKAKDGRTIADLKIDNTLAQRFNEYAKWSKVEARKVENMLFEHMRMYWRWRLKVSPRFKSLVCYQSANAQDKADMLASEEEFKLHVAKIESNNKMKRDAPAVATFYKVITLGGTDLNEAEAAASQEKGKIQDVPPLVHEFFDQHIHDSHASFRLREPLTKEEIDTTIKQTKEKQAKGKNLNHLEHRIITQDKIKPGSFPVITDADEPDLKDMGGFMTNRALGLIGASRRESGSIIRKRHVLDES